LGASLVLREDAMEATVDTPKLGRRPHKIDGELLERVKKYASRFLSKRQISYLIGWGESTLYEKLNTFPEFSEAFEEGRASMVDKAFGVVENHIDRNDLKAAMWTLERGAGWQDKKAVEHEVGDKYAQLVMLSMDPSEKNHEKAERVDDGGSGMDQCKAGAQAEADIDASRCGQSAAARHGVQPTEGIPTEQPVLVREQKESQVLLPDDHTDYGE
jgi:hypothetical protein